MRRALTTRRVGHAGTLDPLASGLLVVLVGRATRLAPFLAGLPKRYHGVIVLGAATDTDDRTGMVLETSDAWRTLSDDAVLSAMCRLTGRYAQRPPAFSARKLAGERAHRLARRGERVDLPPTQVEVRRFALVERDGARIAFDAAVTSGTYVRALARDLGRHLGCGAHLDTLRRTGVGPFDVASAIPVAQLASRPCALRPPAEAVAHLPHIVLDAPSKEHVVHGRPITAPPDVRGPVALLADGRLAAIAEVQDGTLKPRVVFPE